MEGIIRVDPGIADIKNDNNTNLLHYAVMFNSTPCAEVLLKLAPHLFDNVTTTDNDTPLQFAKIRYPDSIEVAKMLEDHLKNR